MLGNMMGTSDWSLQPLGEVVDVSPQSLVQPGRHPAPVGTRPGTSRVRLKVRAEGTGDGSENGEESPPCIASPPYAP